MSPPKTHKRESVCEGVSEVDLVAYGTTAGVNGVNDECDGRK